MDASLPELWREAFRRDLTEPPALPDPLPERRLARLLAAYIVAGLVFLVLPGTVLGVWNLVGISSQRQLAGVSAAWIQAHGHAQFFGWVGTFIIGISLYTLPKFRGSMCRSVRLGWVLWVLWTGGVGLRWAVGIAGAGHPAAFRVSAAMELVAGVLLLWQVTPAGPKHKKGQAWELPVFSGLTALVAVLGWQLWLSMWALDGAGVAAEPDRALISVAIWGFALPVVVGYCAKFFAGLLGAAPVSKSGLRGMVALAGVAAAGFVANSTVVAGAGCCGAVALAWRALRLFHAPVGTPKTTGVYRRYPAFARLAYAWLGVAALLGLGVARPGMLGASRHAFTVGFLATLIFAIGPRILPSFLNSRELWSARLMQGALWILTGGCTLRVVCEPLAYGGLVPAAWKVLPISAFAELTAVLVFALNLAMSLATPVPSWFGRKHVHDGMSVYWLVASYPGTRKVLVAGGLATLAHARQIPKSLSLREAAQADGVPSAALVEQLGDFFEARRPRSLRQPRRTSESMRSTKR